MVPNSAGALNLGSRVKSPKWTRLCCAASSDAAQQRIKGTSYFCVISTLLNVGMMEGLSAHPV